MAEAGRPTKITDEVIIKLEKAFRDGAHVYEACAECEISPDAYYDRLNKDQAFRDRMGLSREYVTELARGVVARAIKSKDRDTAKWWLERKNKKEFAQRTEITGEEGQPVRVEVNDVLDKVYGTTQPDSSGEVPTDS